MSAADTPLLVTVDDLLRVWIAGMATGAGSMLLSRWPDADVEPIRNAVEELIDACERDPLAMDTFADRCTRIARGEIPEEVRFTVHAHRNEGDTQ